MRTYQILSELGTGGMSRVYKALLEFPDDRTHLVAIKVPHAGCHDAGHRELFLREADTAFRLNHDHPNLVTVTDYGETEDGTPYLVMEHIDGVTAGELCEREPLDPAMVGRVAHALLQALAYLHGHGVLHHDVTPGNILVSRTGQVKLSDLGLAKRLSASTSGLMRGTPAYASPEQLRGEQLTEASDLFSLGAVLYKLLTARRPFGESDSPATVHSMHGARPVLPDDTPDELKRLVLGLLELDRARRLTVEQAIDLARAAELDASADDLGTIVCERLLALAGRPRASSGSHTLPDPSPPVLVMPPAIHAHDAGSMQERSTRVRTAIALASLMAILALLISGYALWSMARTKPAPAVAAQPDRPTDETAPAITPIPPARVEPLQEPPSSSGRTSDAAPAPRARHSKRPPRWVIEDLP